MNYAASLAFPFRESLWDRIRWRFALAAAAIAVKDTESFWDSIRRHWAITAAVCESFKKEVLQALHDFTNSTGHVFKIALYSSSATLNGSTTNYSTTNEISGTGYSAGGATIASATPVLSTGGSGAAALCDFADATWSTATITARGALIYNSSASGNKGVQVLDFGSDQTSTAGTFTVVFPAVTKAAAILRLN